MNADAIVKAALAWVGKDFAPGQREQCANFVRSVFRSCGYVLPEAELPSDLSLWPGMPLAASYANSLAGDEIGPKVPRGQEKPGDLWLWRDTYRGDFPRGLITHVGIGVGNGDIVDRSTSAHPVTRRSAEATFPGLLFEIRRPALFLTPGQVGEYVKFFLNGRGARAFRGKDELPEVEIKVRRDRDGSAHVWVNGREVPTLSVDLKLLTRVPPA